MGTLPWPSKPCDGGAKPWALEMAFPGADAVHFENVEPDKGS
jgi:hypothetical protein